MWRVRRCARGRTCRQNLGAGHSLTPAAVPSARKRSFIWFAAEAATCLRVNDRRQAAVCLPVCLRVNAAPDGMKIDYEAPAAFIQ